MWSTSSGTQEDTSTQVKRFACDRCHDQKLRCTRPQENEPCVRCAKAGVNCNVSAAQRTGRPRKSSGPRNGSDKGRKSPTTMDGGASENGSSKGSELVRVQSSESIPVTVSPSLRQTPDFSNHMAWDNFTTGSGSSISSISIPEYGQPIVTDDYADLLDCITDQSYFDNMDMSDFTDCMSLDPSEYLQTSMADFDGIATFLPNMSTEPNPKKRKSTNVAPFYTNQMSMSPQILDNQTAARISSFQEMDLPTLTPSMGTPSEATTPELTQGIILQSEQSHVQTLAKLQSEIDVCSERIMHQARRMHGSPNNYTTESQKLSEALGILLSTAERFIDLISTICRTFDTISSRSASPAATPWGSPSPFTTPQMEATQQGYFNNNNNMSLDPNLLTTGGSRQLSTATFYTMLKCHVRLLSAYDTTLDTMSSRLLELEHIDSMQNITSALSIGSFVVPYGAIIETLLHLQVVSHQLDRLKTALHGNLLKIQPRTVQQNRSLPARLGLCKQGRSPSVGMVDFKLEEIQERERALQTKLLRIEALAESSKQGQIDGGGFQQWM